METATQRIIPNGYEIFNYGSGWTGKPWSAPREESSCTFCNGDGYIWDKLSEDSMECSCSKESNKKFEKENKKRPILNNKVFDYEFDN